MFGLGGMGQGTFINVVWHKSYANMSIMGFESTAWGPLEPDDNLKRPQRPPFISSSHLLVLLR